MPRIKLTITEIECSYCGAMFLASRQRLYDQRRGKLPYCKDECRRAGKAKLGPTLEDRFLAHTRRLPNGCLECNFTPDKDGYPRIWFEGKNRRSSHVAWFRHYGEWPTKGMDLDHICHDPATCDGGPNDPHRLCVEWSHLKLVTKEEHRAPGRTNTSRFGLATGAMYRAKTACKWGHELTEENTYWNNGRRHCKECQRRLCREWHRKKRMEKRENGKRETGTAEAQRPAQP